ncbi:MAG: hypothetical protein ACOCXT_05740 [Candidatus Dojkabacteria bacterium]
MKQILNRLQHCVQLIIDFLVSLIPERRKQPLIVVVAMVLTLVIIAVFRPVHIVFAPWDQLLYVTAYNFFFLALFAGLKLLGVERRSVANSVIAYVFSTVMFTSALFFILYSSIFSIVLNVKLILLLSLFTGTALMLTTLGSGVLGILLYYRGLFKGNFATRLFHGFLIVVVLAGLAGGMLVFLPQGTREQHRGVAQAPSFVQKIDIEEVLAGSEKFDFSQFVYGDQTFTERYGYTERDGVGILEGATVSGAAFIENWTGFRTTYWGFGPEELPLNAVGWLPDTDTPRPLVVIVHGNSAMQKPSHEGYAYLGESLAEMGYVVVSLDQNYLNLAPELYGNIIEDNDARGWLILEHIQLILQKNSSEDSALYNKIDRSSIALIGHSRGGEAATIAKLFSELEQCPVDSYVRCNYDFNITTVIALAPTDSQYKPAGEELPFANCNYLVLQGAMDYDISGFSGLRTYDRLQFLKGNEDEDFIKTYVYIGRANHANFNTVWGDYDADAPFHWFVDTNKLLDGSLQRKIASLYVRSFLESTLHNRTELQPVFQDYRTIADALPDTQYRNGFQSSDYMMITNFDEDIDPARIPAIGLSEGMGLEGGEIEIQLRHPSIAGVSRNTVLELAECVSCSVNALYNITFDEPLDLSNALEETAAHFQFDLGHTGGDEAEYLLDVVLVDGADKEVTLSITPDLYPVNDLLSSYFTFPLSSLTVKETVPQTVSLPLNQFQGAESFNYENVQAIRFRPKAFGDGSFILDNIGFLLE